MSQETEKNLAETAVIEEAALRLVQSDMQSAEQPPQPTPAQQAIAQMKRRETMRRTSERDAALRARREMYGDKTVPRIRAERRYGGSSHSRAYLKQALCLYSDRAQRFFEEHYERVNMSLIVSTLVIEAIGGIKLADEIAMRIRQEFQDLENQMILSVRELQRIATEKGIPEEQQVPAYDHKRFYEPPLHTPHSVQFMTVVQLYDRIISRAEGCWINNQMSTQTRAGVLSTWEKRLRQFVRDLYEIRLQAVSQARKTGFGKRAAAIEAQVRREHANEHLEKTDLPTTRKDNKPDSLPPSVEKRPMEKAASSAATDTKTPSEVPVKKPARSRKNNSPAKDGSDTAKADPTVTQ